MQEREILQEYIDGLHIEVCMNAPAFILRVNEMNIV